MQKVKNILTPEQQEVLTKIINENLADIFFNPERYLEQDHITLTDLLKPIKETGGDNGD
jgi:hypothetical protein